MAKFKRRKQRGPLTRAEIEHLASGTPYLGASFGRERWSLDGTEQTNSPATLDSMQTAWRDPEVRSTVRSYQEARLPGAVVWSDLAFGETANTRAPDMAAVDAEYLARWEAAIEAGHKAARATKHE